MVGDHVPQRVVVPQNQRPSADRAAHHPFAGGMEDRQTDEYGLHQAAGVRPLCRPAAGSRDAATKGDFRNQRSCHHH